jgi:hypothetical protein
MRRGPRLHLARRAESFHELKLNDSGNLCEGKVKWTRQHDLNSLLKLTLMTLMEEE